MVLRLTLFFTSLGTLALIHIVAVTFFLYWKYPWFDIPMHLFGGVCIAFGVSILPFFRINFFEHQKHMFFWYIMMALCVGLLWEIFEYSAGISSVLTKSDFILDTLSDLTMDLVGGVLGCGMVKRIYTL